MSNPAVAWNDVAFAYDGQEVLRPSSFTIPQGICAGVMGPNGGGKTTLLKLLMGFLQPASGAIELLGKGPIEARPFVSYVPQFLRSDREFPITLEEIVSMGALSDRSKEANVRDWMKK